MVGSWLTCLINTTLHIHSGLSSRKCTLTWIQQQQQYGLNWQLCHWQSLVKPQRIFLNLIKPRTFWRNAQLRTAQVPAVVTRLMWDMHGVDEHTYSSDIARNLSSDIGFPSRLIRSHGLFCFRVPASSAFVFCFFWWENSKSKELRGDRWFSSLTDRRIYQIDMGSSSGISSSGVDHRITHPLCLLLSRRWKWNIALKGNPLIGRKHL